MKAVGFSDFGGPDVVHSVELSDPQPAEGQVRIRVAAATVNPTDILLRSGGRPGALTGEPPFVAGLELAGTVDSIGPGVTQTVGEAVVAMTTSVPAGRGAQAELVVTDARSTARAPKGIDLVAAATLPMNGMTARLGLDRLGLPPGSTILITGAAGGVGGFATQLAAAEGCEVIAVARDSQEATVRAFGARHFVRRGENIAGAVLAITPGGVDGAIDAATIGSSLLPAIRPGGRLIALRPSDGNDAGAVRIDHIQVRDYLFEQEKLQELVSRVEQGVLRLRVSHVFGSDEGSEAHRAAEESSRDGRVVIKFNTEGEKHEESPCV